MGGSPICHVMTRTSSRSQPFRIWLPMMGPDRVTAHAQCGWPGRSAWAQRPRPDVNRRLGSGCCDVTSRLDDPLRVRENLVFELSGIGDSVRGRDPSELHRDAVFGEERRNLPGQSTAHVILIDDHNPSGPSCRCQHSVAVERGHRLTDGCASHTIGSEPDEQTTAQHRNVFTEKHNPRVVPTGVEPPYQRFPRRRRYWDRAGGLPMRARIA